MQKFLKVKLISVICISLFLQLFLSCNNSLANNSLSAEVIEAQKYLGEVSRIFGPGGTARYYSGQVINDWFGQGFDVTFDGNLVEYESVRQSILDYVEGLSSSNALMHQNYGNISYDSNMKYVEFSSYTDIASGDVVAYEIRIFYGDFWDTYNTDYWYAKSVLFNPSFTENLQTNDPLNFQ